MVWSTSQLEKSRLSLDFLNLLQTTSPDHPEVSRICFFDEKKSVSGWVISLRTFKIDSNWNGVSHYYRSGQQIDQDASRCFLLPKGGVKVALVVSFV